jgi:hypothetical protein
MKTGILTLTATVGVLLLGQTAPQAASAEKVIGKAQTPAAEVSAQRRYRRSHVGVSRPYAPAYRVYGAYGYPVNDPSLGYFPTLRRLQAEGRCVTDEGYGRFSFCDW